MALVATLISDPTRAAITDALLRQVRAALMAEDQWRVLAPGVASELRLPPKWRSSEAASRTLHAALDGAQVDGPVRPLADRRKHLLVADMDSTMIEQECIDELADLLGLRTHVAAITERAMRGEIAFEPALRERVALLKGLPVDRIADLLRDRISLMPGARTLVATMRANGARTCLVSGGFTLFTGPVATRIGFDEAHANVLGLDGARLAGTVEEPIVGREAKRAHLIGLRESYGLTSEQTLAVGDGANDLAMLAEAGLGVAFRAKPAVAAQAHARIEHGDLTALLYLQGYTAADFAA